jgi:hypothetical protein
MKDSVKGEIPKLAPNLLARLCKSHAGSSCKAGTAERSAVAPGGVVDEGNCVDLLLLDNELVDSIAGLYGARLEIALLTRCVY